MLTWILNGAVVLVSVAAMEVAANLIHHYVMHGWGWGWHRSHHEPREGMFEENDLYAVFFAALSVGLIYFGVEGLWPLQWIGLGMAVYGALYFIVHDGLVHQRWPFNYLPTRGYAKRLVQAHRMHHAIEGRDGCVSFGFLYAKPAAELKAELKRQQAKFGKGQRNAPEAKETIYPQADGRS